MKRENSDKLYIKAKRANGKLIGKIDRTGKAFFQTDIDEAAGKITEKILAKEAFKKELANLVIGQ